MKHQRKRIGLYAVKEVALADGLLCRRLEHKNHRFSSSSTCFHPSFNLREASPFLVLQLSPTCCTIHCCTPDGSGGGRGLFGQLCEGR